MASSQAGVLPKVFVEAFSRHGIRLVPYVADHMLDSVTEALKADPRFDVITCTREDEGIGILVGAYHGGLKGALFMQSSGLGLCLNALGSLAIPYQVPALLVVSLRGDLGEFNAAQVRMGQSVPRLCELMGLPYHVSTHLADLELALPGLLETSFHVGIPACLAVRRSVLVEAANREGN